MEKAGHWIKMERSCGTGFFLAKCGTGLADRHQALAGLLAGSKRFMKRISIYQEKGIYLSGEGGSQETMEELEDQEYIMS